MKDKPCVPKAATPKVWHVGSLNIQAGLATHNYRDYLTKAWHHVSPTSETKRQNITPVAHLARHLDIFGVQEIDPGSWRSGYINQADILAEEGKFPFWSQQSNRTTRFSVTGNALFSRTSPLDVEYWALPSSRSAKTVRGAVMARFFCASTQKEWCCVVAHLSLSRADRLAQSSFLAERLKDEPRLLLMGDFNAEPDHADMRPLKSLLDQHTQDATYPRWAPQKNIDLIWWKGISPLTQVVHSWGVTDHRAVEVSFHL